MGSVIVSNNYGFTLLTVKKLAQVVLKNIKMW